MVRRANVIFWAVTQAIIACVLNTTPTKASGLYVGKKNATMKTGVWVVFLITLAHLHVPLVIRRGIRKDLHVLFALCRGIRKDTITMR